jgi:hypothetical protein
MRAPHRLQTEARCWVLRTGTFLNIVAINIFIGCSFDRFDVPRKEQRRCQLRNDSAIDKLILYFA